MKIYILPADAHGCGHYRLIWPADALKQEGFDVNIIPPSNRTGFLAKIRENAHGGETLTSVQVPDDCDVLVLQRPAHPLQPQMINLMRSNGIAVIVDMDDDMSTIHPDNIAYHIYRPSSGSPFSWKWADESCRITTMVTTSTQRLQRTYAPHGRGMVLDNYVPEAYLSWPRAQTGMFGWAGTSRSHPNDPQVSAIGVKKLIDAGYHFKIVGGDEGCRNTFRLPFRPDMTGIVSMAEFAATIGQTLDVGIVPLANTSFNAAKSRLKGIEMMAVGVPWVASPREEYRRLKKESGVGLTADTPKEWYLAVKKLMDDDVLRAEQVKAGDEYMATQTYQANAWRWMEAWQRAYDMEKGRVHDQSIHDLRPEGENVRPTGGGGGEQVRAAQEELAGGPGSVEQAVGVGR